MDVDDPHCSDSLQPVEKLHEASQPSDGAFGVAVPTTFAVLDGKCDRTTVMIREESLNRKGIRNELHFH